MAEYYLEIQNAVRTALDEMNSEHERGKLIDAPVPNNHYLVRWITKAIKSQRFNRCISPDLAAWQGMGRSKGNKADLVSVFRRIAAYYDDFFQGDRDNRLTDAQVESFLDAMEAAGWEVTTSEPLVDAGKVQLYTEQQNSLALCANQCDSCFDGPNLIKPMSWFVRGNHNEFVEKAYQHGFMVHKNSDYKSNVKYHGEYFIFPLNQGTRLAEIPLGYSIA